jgi:hypothetical protein
MSDTSSLVTLTDSCLDGILYFFHDHFNVRFIIPPKVEEEGVKRPLSTGLKQYAFSALRLQHAMKRRVVITVDAETKRMTEKILFLANNLFFIKGKAMRLVHHGEAEMIALGNILNLTTLLVDERTTRMLIESPFKIKEHLEQEFKVNIMVHRDNLFEFSNLTKGMDIIRSSELVILAYENGYFDQYDTLRVDILEAALHKVKFSGCAIRFDEIKQFIDGVRV